MTAVTRALFIEQGATFVLGFAWHQTNDDGTVGPAYDLTNASARMMIRHTLNGPVLVSATSENGRIELGGVDGRVLITLTDADTDQLTVTAGVYDLELKLGPVDSDAAVYRLLEGKVAVSLSVTRGT